MFDLSSNRFSDNNLEFNVQRNCRPIIYHIYVPISLNILFLVVFLYGLYNFCIGFRPGLQRNGWSGAGHTPCLPNPACLCGQVCPCESDLTFDSRPSTFKVTLTTLSPTDDQLFMRFLMYWQWWNNVKELHSEQWYTQRVQVTAIWLNKPLIDKKNVNPLIVKEPLSAGKWHCVVAIYCLDIYHF